MPRYGDPDYDPDYDDSPPPSPKARTFQNVSSYSTTRLLARRLWRSRSVILTLGLIVGTIYLWTKVRHSVGRVSHEPSLSFTNVNWKLYAYTQYATDGAHLCNALMVFEALHRLGSKAQRILIYPDSMDTEIKNGRDRDGQLLNMAMRKYNVKLVPMKLEAVMKACKALLVAIHIC